MVTIHFYNAGNSAQGNALFFRPTLRLPLSVRVFQTESTLGPKISSTNKTSDIMQKEWSMSKDNKNRHGMVSVC